MRNQEKIFVIGHKNPDTDSICSALAYAYLKNTLEGGGYIAARAGQLNQETQYVLNYFQAEAPVYVADGMTQVKDSDPQDRGRTEQSVPEAGLESDAPHRGGDPADYQGSED